MSALIPATVGNKANIWEFVCRMGAAQLRKVRQSSWVCMSIFASETDVT